MSSEKEVLTDEEQQAQDAAEEAAPSTNDPEAKIDEKAAENDTEETPAQESEEVDELTAARLEAAQFQDRYLRAAAELENFRKRTVKARAETRDDTLRDMLLQIAPLLDNLRRALDQETDDAAAVRTGVEIIVTQFREILSGYGLQEIEAMGKPFDPNEHEAMMQVPTAEHPPGTVMQEMEKGFRLRDRVVRPSRVIVSSELDADAKQDDKTNTTESDEEGQA